MMYRRVPQLSPAGVPYCIRFPTSSREQYSEVRAPEEARKATARPSKRSKKRISGSPSLSDVGRFIHAPLSPLIIRPRSLPGAALCLNDSFLLGHHPAITPRPFRPRASQAGQLPPGSSSNHIVLRERTHAGRGCRRPRGPRACTGSRGVTPDHSHVRGTCSHWRVARSPAGYAAAYGQAARQSDRRRPPDREEKEGQVHSQIGRLRAASCSGNATVMPVRWRCCVDLPANTLRTGVCTRGCVLCYAAVCTQKLEAACYRPPARQRRHGRIYFVVIVMLPDCEVVQQFGILHLFDLPIQPSLSASGDTGVPEVVADPKGEVAKTFQNLGVCVVQQCAKTRLQVSTAVSYDKSMRAIRVRVPELNNEFFLHPAMVRRNDRSAQSVATRVQAGGNQRDVFCNLQDEVDVLASVVEDEWTGEQKLQFSDVPEDIVPEEIRPMGNYAVLIAWPDGFNQLIKIQVLNSNFPTLINPSIVFLLLQLIAISHLLTLYRIQSRLPPRSQAPTINSDAHARRSSPECDRLPLVTPLRLPHLHHLHLRRLAALSCALPRPSPADRCFWFAILLFDGGHHLTCH
ncbi:hypothetical protein AXF42_Ash010972 [Apostasia shenzhenica]|uniref:Gamma-butyrobetaine hydroxylase-like N-terminal domain-containing protein n=1 Tax=Apostasia shenzhenica TaxID=1088818 RepID=A0A2H9ZQR8_9ASPA|nr:hypothetical protein AXF42_Ash010972 [Apostasia shenzhenica]